ncbi:HAMP domain-containing histidine kinase [Anabaena cylindrica FACHB-243]|uniref:histidine kinase n=1 Tax=Anabaena cylindrica (strain ATCC 27899 / PCC 7122) TaxID=272123 RepID=K9ZIY7_ANACC|nr:MULTISPECIES: HAMP domain-containing sensor histidine kinase [Anabaena]AFZ58709.1 integral membrane sensor signal transduction histidine kinase [Anabaena cylindrica PCC 7122]MBD2420052.1 HAMP domain-containing histidine kinase [Anabaena cylindrica FACHB-243]MBY5282977.1 HAMP domain-containing histidine kinase [Anabaena sp. CCAP 1446/1C]MBY5306524.1 HAMP domain-containing histidine kinase [Anabaena sp. CCAP 1446/1C]MCM2407052.1 HAMP domain-containing histidine kinase [Anabaena sp. CCAP 1446/
MVYFLAKSPDQESSLGKYLLIVILFIIALVLEYFTPTEYVFGYLYTGPILLANSWLGRRGNFQTTFIAVCLTMLNLVVPGGEEMKISTIASRAIAGIALIVTGVLSDRLRRSEDAIAITRAKLEAQEELSRVREDFASTLTHDLKTPLLGAIETLKAFEQEKFGVVLPAQQKVLATMTRSHQTSLQLLETLLDIYRNDTEGLKLVLAPVDLAILAEDTAATLSELASSRRVYLSLNYGDSDWRQSLWVKGDALQLQRVFTNLLINAINHSRRGERVEVVLESQASYQVVKILDTGAGIQPEQFPYLFERFYQGHSNRQAKGSGLGLYLSRQIIEAHNGIIWAENRVPIGAMFAFKLPVNHFSPL